MVFSFRNICRLEVWVSFVPRPRAALVGGSGTARFDAAKLWNFAQPSHHFFWYWLLFESVVVSPTMINGTAARKLAQTATTAGARYVFFLL